MISRHNHKKGFTLPELLVSMTVLVLVIFAATNLLVSIIRSNNENLNTLIAYGLAQEGIEGVRNIRDSNWLLGARFDGSLKLTKIWGEIFNSTEEEQFYTIDLNAVKTSNIEVKNPNELTNHTPWQLKVVKDVSGTETLIRKFFVAGGDGEFRYGHNVGSQPGEDTPFRRYVSIKKVPTDYGKEGELMKIRVASYVEWIEAGRSKAVRLDTELTDWFEGQ